MASDPWPYYLSKDFYRVSEEVRNTGGFSTLYLAPWVEDESEWDRYVNDQVTAGNVAESLLVSKDENHVTTTPVLPIWQVAPDMYTSVLNYNLLELDVVNEAVKAHSTKDESFHIGSLAMGADGNKHTGIEAFTIQSFGKQDGSDGKPGGYLLAVSPWEDLFGGILPLGSEPLTASIYRLNNPSIILANVYVDGPEATLSTEPVEETKGRCHDQQELEAIASKSTSQASDKEVEISLTVESEPTIRATSAIMNMLIKSTESPETSKVRMAPPHSISRDYPLRFFHC